jgi:hypothetical protein
MQSVHWFFSSPQPAPSKIKIGMAANAIVILDFIKPAPGARRGAGEDD